MSPGKQLFGAAPHARSHTAPRTCHSQNRVVSVFPNLLRPGTRAFLKSPSILLQIPLKSPPNPLETPLKPPYMQGNFTKTAIISLQNKPLFECRNSTARSRGFQGKSSHFFRHAATVVAHKYDTFFTPRTPLRITLFRTKKEVYSACKFGT